MNNKEELWRKQRKKQSKEFTSLTLICNFLFKNNDKYKNMFVKKWKLKVASSMKINYNKSDVLLTDTVKILYELHIITDV